MRSSVVLPAPFAPSTTHRSAAFTVHSMSVEDPCAVEDEAHARGQPRIGRSLTPGEPRVRARWRSTTRSYARSAARSLSGLRRRAGAGRLMVVVYHAVFFNTFFRTTGGSFSALERGRRGSSS